MTQKERIEASKCYEQACQAIMYRHRQELGWGRIEGSKYYLGKLSRARRGRQIDATIHLPDGQLVLVECKQWNKELDVQDVEAYDAKVRLDLGMDGAMMVSCVGFTEAAVNYAQARNVGLVTLNSTATQDAYIMKLEDWTLLGFLETGAASEEVVVTTEVMCVDTVVASEEISITTQAALGDTTHVSSEGSLRQDSVS